MSVLHTETGSTRESIIHMLRSQGSLTIQIIAEQLSLTGMAVRRHMHELEKQQLVQVTTVITGKGRPTYHYALTEAAEALFPRNYQMLALDLLQELSEEEETKPIVNKMFQGRKKKLYTRYANQMSDATLAQRVIALTTIQTAAGYMAESSSEGEHYYIAEYNCPIKDVAKSYKQACQCELELFSELLQTDVERTECITNGQKRCLYKIAKQK
jgi:predicted ArsR family transcriptional regulator